MIMLLLCCGEPAVSPAPPPPEPPPAPVEPPPPDPCRHSVLEQSSPATLAELSGDADCTARLTLWREGRRIWAASADLDGDAVSENIVVLAAEPALLDAGQPCPDGGCLATLVVADVAADLRFETPDAATFRLIDADPSDPRQEVLVGAERFSYDGEALSATPHAQDESP